MNFRYDINGLRAIAVIAVVLFHFKPAWLPGGFAGVDVFFVISGFLMTSIVVRAIDEKRFGLLKFYLARANRIVPALAILCLTLLVLGWFILLPEEYAALGKHAWGSVAFISNFMYWQEAGYFDAASHQKWLLHTWSLAVEWQFYLLYPLVLLGLSRLGAIAGIKRGVLLLTGGLFIYSALTSVLWPSASYYLLAARAWELLLGGLAFLYPLSQNQKYSRIFNVSGIGLIVAAYVLVDESISWPGYMALVPVAGTYLVLIAARQDSILTNNRAFQALGRWSYSIYLWHWPVVVLGYRYDITYWWIPGMLVCVLLGFISYRFIENIKWRRLEHLFDLWQAKPLWLGLLVIIMGSTVVIYQGVIERFSAPMQQALNSVTASPKREQCHIDEYQNPTEACEYFGKDIRWAVFGDSHTVELAYALALQLKQKDQGVKHFSFSGCSPSLLHAAGSSRCTRWYKESVKAIAEDNRIQHVLINHRYSWSLAGEHGEDYPKVPDITNNARAQRIVKSLDATIHTLAAAKQTVFITLPIPELPKPVMSILADIQITDESPEHLPGATIAYYQKRNAFILQHFKQAQYPPNVKFLNPVKALCNKQKCMAVIAGQALYFDDNHPSVTGAQRIIELLPEKLR